MQLYGENVLEKPNSPSKMHQIEQGEEYSEELEQLDTSYIIEYDIAQNLLVNNDYLKIISTTSCPVVLQHNLNTIMEIQNSSKEVLIEKTESILDGQGIEYDEDIE